MVNSESSPELPTDLCEKGLDPHSPEDEELRALIVAAIVCGGRQYIQEHIKTKEGKDEL